MAWNFPLAVHHKELGNSNIHVYTISFVINVANCSNDWSIGWPLWKQASTALVFTQPISKLMNMLSSCYRVSVHQHTCVPKPSTQRGWKLSTLSQPVSNPSTLYQPVSKLSTKPVLKRSITFHQSWFGPARSKLASLPWNQLASLETGLVMNLSLTHKCVALLKLRLNVLECVNAVWEALPWTYCSLS